MPVKTGFPWDLDIHLITNTHPGSEENGAGVVRLMQGVAVISPIII